MGISLKGHTPDFQYWAFDIDGKSWVAVNQSTPEPLNINFVGTYRDWPSTLPLINTSGFDIIASTTAKTNDIGEKQGMVEWVWSGQKYRSNWILSAGREIVVGDAETPSVFEYGLNFVGRVPYDGPAGGPVGPVSTPPPTVPQQVNEAVTDTKDSLEAANKALAVSEAQRKVDLQALNTARAEIENAKKSLADAQAKATQEQKVLLAQMQEQLEVMQERANVQINIYRQMLAQSQTPPPTKPSPTTPPSSPVVTTPTPTTPAPTAAPATDWPGLLLKLGAAYLLLQ